jgi:hypothetical protein
VVLGIQYFGTNNLSEENDSDAKLYPASLSCKVILRVCEAQNNQTTGLLYRIEYIRTKWGGKAKSKRTIVSYVSENTVYTKHKIIRRA